MVNVTLTNANINSGNPVVIYCSGVTVGYQKSNSKQSNAQYNSDGSSVDVINGSIENPTYILQNVKFDVSGGITYAQFLSFLKSENTSTNRTYLSIPYGSLTSPSYVTALDGSTTAIPVTMNGTNAVTISYRDTKNGYIPTISINLVET